MATYTHNLIKRDESIRSASPNYVERRIFLCPELKPGRWLWEITDTDNKAPASDDNVGQMRWENSIFRCVCIIIIKLLNSISKCTKWMQEQINFSIKKK